MSLWSEKVHTHWDEVEKLSEVKLGHFAAACVSHALMRSLPEFAGLVSEEALQVARSGIEILDGIMREHRPCSDFVAAAKRVEDVLPEVDSDEDLVWGWESALFGIRAALLCTAGKDARLNASIAVERAYEVIAEPEREEALWELGSMDASRMLEVERASAACQSEVTFQLDYLAQL